MEVFFILQNKREALTLTAALSALSAVGIILGKFLAFNITEFMRFSLENISIIFAGIVFGPIAGFAVGMVQDLIGCICVGYAINPIITLGCCVSGLLSGLVFKYLGKVKTKLKVVLSVACAHLIGSVIIKSAGLSVFYGLPYFETVLWRILNYSIVGAIEAILLCLMLKSKQLLSVIHKIYSKSQI